MRSPDGQPSQAARQQQEYGRGHHRVAPHARRADHESDAATERLYAAKQTDLVGRVDNSSLTHRGLVNEDANNIRGNALHCTREIKWIRRTKTVLAACVSVRHLREAARMADANKDRLLANTNTLWGLVTEANHGPEEAAQRARAALLDRYKGAVHAYLLGALRDANAADDLAQEF